ncbi:signal peptidase I [Bacillus luteolus]|uniref:Signal peptidase I n=1 Tax=Litchfieldia luteola TaxID=682179 RepID=A0ABR9QDX9_9BACI|nr:signal peptidase I [Cytobacillus luteolus]MBE4906698.1 signal peptidase I [Cytobacillus luteolus]MBP1940654.1 signal peptidase I [Cytobacillus luteolus]
MEGKSKKNRIWVVKSVGIGIILFIFLRTFLLSNYVVEGESMMPTLQNGNLLMVNKVSLHIGDLQRFDIVVFKSESKEHYVKRVIGLPGDKVEYIDDILYINGLQIDEPFLSPYKNNLIGGNLTGDFSLEEITGQKQVPPGHIFVIGDNRLGSWDSRHYGFIKIDHIVGKVNLRYWPVNVVDLRF